MAKPKRPVWRLLLCAVLALALLTGCMIYKPIHMKTLPAFQRALRRAYPCITGIETKIGQDYNARIIITTRDASTAQLSAIALESKAFLSGAEFLAELEQTFPPQEAILAHGNPNRVDLSLSIQVATPSGVQRYYGASADYYTRSGAVDHYQTWQESWSGRVLPGRMQTQAVTFPAHRFSETERNADELAAAPFTLTLSLPDTWSVAVPSSAGEAGPGVSPVYLMAGGVRMATVDYNTFSLSPAPPPDVKLDSPRYYRMIYSPLMPGDGVDWDCGYFPVKRDETCCVAVCEIAPDPLPESGAVYRPGILAHNVSMGVWVSIAFENPAISPELVGQIAASITLARP